MHLLILGEIMELVSQPLMFPPHYRERLEYILKYFGLIFDYSQNERRFLCVIEKVFHVICLQKDEFFKTLEWIPDYQAKIEWFWKPLVAFINKMVQINDIDFNCLLFLFYFPFFDKNLRNSKKTKAKVLFLLFFPLFFSQFLNIPSFCVQRILLGSKSLSCRLETDLRETILPSFPILKSILQISFQKPQNLRR